MKMLLKGARITAALIVASAAMLSAPVHSSAAARAVGYLDVASAYVEYGYPTSMHVGGWAFNRYTVPVQEVRVLSIAGSGVFNTQFLTANKYRPDVLRAGAATTAYVGYDSYLKLNQVPTYVCVDTHDKGEVGGWVRLGCKTPTVSRIS